MDTIVAANNPDSSSRWKQTIKQILLQMNSQLQIETAAAIIERRVAGLSWDTPAFWEQPGIAARSTFNKWKKDDPNFSQLLEEAWQVAQHYRADVAADAVDAAVLTLQAAAPLFVKTVVEVSQNTKDQRAALAAAFGGLDRASKLTASKAPDALPADIQVIVDFVYGGEGDEQPDTDEDYHESNT